MTTIEIKTALYNLLDAASSATVYEVGHVPTAAAFPYVVYALGTSIEGLVDNTAAIQYPLEIDVLDHDLAKNTAAIEALADALDLAINRCNLNLTTLYAYIIREGREANAPTPDEFTFRRNLRYVAQIYSK